MQPCCFLNSFRPFWIHPRPSGFICALLGSSAPFWVHPRPSGFIRALLDSSARFWIHPRPSGFICALLDSSAPFWVHPCLSGFICAILGSSAPFWQINEPRYMPNSRNIVLFLLSAVCFYSFEKLTLYKYNYCVILIIFSAKNIKCDKKESSPSNAVTLRLYDPGWGRIFLCSVSLPLFVSPKRKRGRPQWSALIFYSIQRRYCQTKLIPVFRILQN